MASARLEAEDFLVIEPCAPYPPRRNTSRRRLYGMITRLRGLVDETAQAQPAGNAVGCVAPNMDVGNPGRTMHCTGERARGMAENGAQRKRPSSGLEGRPPGQSNAYICVYAYHMCGTENKCSLLLSCLILFGGHTQEPSPKGNLGGVKRLCGALDELVIAGALCLDLVVKLFDALPQFPHLVGK